MKNQARFNAALTTQGTRLSLAHTLNVRSMELRDLETSLIKRAYDQKGRKKMDPQN